MPESLSRRKLIKRLGVFGFTGPFSGGRHQFMQKDDLKLRIPNPHQKEISKPLIKEIIKQAGISQREWDSV